jgi:hypothetical protein
VTTVLQAVPDVVGALAPLAGLADGGGFADAFSSMADGGGFADAFSSPEIPFDGGGDDFAPEEIEAAGGITSETWFLPAVGIAAAFGIYMVTRKKSKAA